MTNLRLGVITLGDPLSTTPSLLTALRERHVDVVTRSSDLHPIRVEAERLTLADCDGVLMTMGKGAKTDEAAEATLQIPCPILLVGSTPELEDGKRDVPAEIHSVVMTLASVSDALWPDKAVPDCVETWLRENSRANRQKGYEAAQKLRGVRLFREGPDINIDPAKAVEEHMIAHFYSKLSWLERFGVLVCDEEVPSDPRADDIHVFDGDTLGALTRYLLQQVSNSMAVRSVNRSFLRYGPSGLNAQPVTLVEIALFTYQTRSFSGTVYRVEPVGRIVLGFQEMDGSYAMDRWTYGFLNMADKIVHLYCADGDHAGAMRAALDTLGVANAILRDR